MKRFIKLSLILIVFALSSFLLFTKNSQATQTFVDFCHCEQPDANGPFQCQTFNNMPLSAWESGHQSQHQADHLGVCSEDACNNIEGVQEKLPENYYQEEGACYPKTPVCRDRKALNYDYNFNEKKEYKDNSVCTYKEAEYKTIDIVKQCDGTTDVTVTTNTHRIWKINDGEPVEIGVKGGGGSHSYTWEDVPEGFILYWANVGKDDWKEADLKSESYTVNESEASCVIPTPEPTRGTSEAGAPQCSDSRPLVLPSNVHVIRNGSDATVNFFTQSSNANIYYRTSGQSVWQHALRDIPVTNGYVSVTIHDLVPTGDYDFGIQSANSCAGGEVVLAVVEDDYSPRTFMFSWYEWLK